MARYKAIDTSPRFLAVYLERQLLPGSFEHAVHHLLEHKFDLSLFDNSGISPDMPSSHVCWLGKLCLSAHHAAQFEKMTALSLT